MVLCNANVKFWWEEAAWMPTCSGLGKPEGSSRQIIAPVTASRLGRGQLWPLWVAVGR